MQKKKKMSRNATERGCKLSFTSNDCQSSWDVPIRKFCAAG